MVMDNRSCIYLDYTHVYVKTFISKVLHLCMCASVCERVLLSLLLYIWFYIMLLEGKVLHGKCIYTQMVWLHINWVSIDPFTDWGCSHPWQDSIEWENIYRWYTIYCKSRSAISWMECASACQFPQNKHQTYRVKYNKI